MKAKTPAVGVETKDHEVTSSQETRQELASIRSREEIQRRAYEIHIERGGIHGWDLDDWLQAEQELSEKSNAR